MYQERCWEFFPAGDCFRKQYEDQLNWSVLGATDSSLSYCNLSKALYSHLPSAYPSNLSYCSLRSPCSTDRQVLNSAPLSQSRRSYISRAPLPAPDPKPSSQLFLIQTVNSPALLQLPAHFVWNASKTLYIGNIRLYAVQYVTGGTSRFSAQMRTSLLHLILHSQ